MSETLDSVAIDVDHKELAVRAAACPGKEQGGELIGGDGLLNQVTKTVLEMPK